MISNYKIFIHIILFINLLFFAQLSLANQTEDIRISITLQNQSLKTALENIERQTGLTFIVDSSIITTQISGIFKNVTPYDFFSRALKNENIALLTDTENSRIIISNLKSGEKTVTEALPESANFEKAGNDFFTSEANYISHAKQTTKEAKENELQDLKIDHLTGKSWVEMERQINPSKMKKRKNIQLGKTDFLEAEAEYIAIAKAKIIEENAPKKDIETTKIDPLTKKTWTNIEMQLN